jgi:copper chaperone CopZ
MTCRHNQITVSSLRINNPPAPGRSTSTKGGSTDRPPAVPTNLLRQQRIHPATMAPVILQMDVHCARCARRIRKALKGVHGAFPSMAFAFAAQHTGARARGSRRLAPPGHDRGPTHARTHADADLYIMRAGVEDVWASVDTGLVVVAGYALDASLLRWRVQSRSRRPVVVVSDGGAAEDALPPPDSAQMVHLGPPGGYPQYYGWAPAHHHQLPLHGRYEAPPAYYGGHDDNPNGCCTMQ